MFVLADSLYYYVMLPVQKAPWYRQPIHPQCNTLRCLFKKPPGIANQYTRNVVWSRRDISSFNLRGAVIAVSSGGDVVERRKVNLGDGGSILPTAVRNLNQFRSTHICLCLSEETLVGGPAR